MAPTRCGLSSPSRTDPRQNAKVRLGFTVSSLLADFHVNMKERDEPGEGAEAFEVVLWSRLAEEGWEPRGVALGRYPYQNIRFLTGSFSGRGGHVCLF